MRENELRATGYYIALAGQDGSGKTTIGNALLARSERKSGYLWFRFSHMTSAPLLALARLLGATSVQKSGFSIHRFGNHVLIGFLYPRMLYVDMRAYAFLRIRAPLRKGRFLLLDRCPIDSVVDLAIDLEDEEFIESSLATRFGKLLPPNQGLTVIVETDLGVIVQRRQELKIDTTIETRARLYRRISESWGIPRVSNDGDLEKTIQDLEEVMRSLKA